MTEKYVEDVIATVASATRKRGVNELLFWEWLGNSEFAEDQGHLTKERASQIRAERETLLDKFLSWGE